MASDLALQLLLRGRHNVLALCAAGVDGEDVVEDAVVGRLHALGGPEVAPRVQWQ